MSLSSIASHGLSALMEATRQQKEKKDASDELCEAFEGAIDDDIIKAVTGADNDDVEDDMDGDGVGDDEKMEELLSKIPPADEAAEEDAEEITEAFFGDAENTSLMESMGMGF